MKKMPIELKNKLRQIHKTANKMSQLSYEFDEMVNKYGLTLELFIACAGLSINEQTEAFTDISNGEGDIEDNIEEIEKIFLLHVNRKNEEE